MTRFFVRHPVSSWMGFTAFVVLGVYALPRLQVEAIPNVDLPTLTVQTSWNGASPQAIQRSITLPVEEAVRNVRHIEKVESSSRAGMSTVEISFRRGTDMEFARLELNEQLGSVRRSLPANASQPEILPYVPEEFRTEDFFTVSLESSLPPGELRERAERWIVPQILAIEGVADAQVRGGGRPILKVILDRTLLARHGITADEVFLAVDQLDALAGAGAVLQDGREMLVTVRDPVDLRRLEEAVVVRRGGRSFTVGMLADLKPDLEDPGYIVRANGQNTVQIAVEKRSGANSVGVSRALRAALPKIESSVPFAVDFHVDEDEGHDLQQKLEELVVRSFVILGLLFLLIIISLRRVQLTSIVMASIFFAVVISFSFFYFVRISVNFITISAIAICFGIIVDNSILVLDEVHRRLESLARADEAGLSRRTKLKIAARTIIEACRAVTFPIFATTLATVVVFLSFIFLSGRLAVYYVPLGVAVATAMAASLFVALGWLPVALNQGWAASVVRRSKDGAREIDDAGALAAFVEEQPDLTTKLGFLERLWDWTQRLWWIVLPATTALVIWSGFLYKNKVIKGGFWRLPNEEELFLYLEMPAGTDINVTSETLAGFEAALLPIPEGARMRATTFGNQAVLRVEFDDKMLRTEYPTMYRTLLVEEADRTGGISIFIRGFADQPYFKGAFGGSALNSLVKISGYNSKRLNDIAETALADIQRQRRVRNARLTTGAMWERANQEETVILLNRDRLAEENVSAVEIIGHLRRLIGVDIPWTMLIEGDQVRVQLAFDDSETLEYSDLTEKRITTPSGAEVRLGDLVTVETRPLSGPITRDDQRYTVNLNWEYVGTDKMRQAYIKHVLAGLSLPYGYEAEEGQQEFFTQEEEEELTLTLVLALVFIYIVLAALFESVTLPILVLMSVPLGLVGVIVAYWLTHTTFDSSARIGLVLLFGVVVNNAILLVNRIQTESSLILRAKLGGDPEREAAIFPGLRKTLGGSDLHALDARERGPLLRRAVARAMRSRLRSIYLTTSTTVIGLVPLLFTLRFKDGRLVLPFRETEGGEIWENLALTSIGGLLSSTVLILICLPPLYYASVRAWWGVRRLARRRGTSDRITRQR